MILDTHMLLLAFSFFAIALVYSSVGFGGGSSYLALLALFLPNFLEIKSTALFCNLAVVSGSTFLFIKDGQFDTKKFLPMVACSIPAAFLGATVVLSKSIFFICLGSVLAFSGLLLIIQFFAIPSPILQIPQRSKLQNVVLGGGAGFVSGLVGIGGGILISPVLHLLQWAEARKIAALASFFILVNSAAGLLGQAASGNLHVNPSLLGLLLLAVIAGGQLGTRLSLRQLKPSAIRALTGVLVLYVGVKLVMSHSLGISI
ncbi:sulfite exporter TauE/SafE family protein [Rufibacter roseus]|uniref:Probable membrane transporter protein n=1 Tax=Rufibacter roseus TaxID=1567108 RepID=A0ABW2DME3_9BACT|nr:sulfite exporter TauE/SafE family protein [Rufibacter roseus]